MSHRNGVADLSGNVVWQPINIADYAAIHDITIRCGESLLLTGGAGGTQALQIEVTDNVGATYRSCAGTAGQLFPVIFDRAGIFTATATLNGVSAGSL